MFGFGKARNTYGSTFFARAFGGNLIVKEEMSVLYWQSVGGMW